MLLEEFLKEITCILQAKRTVLQRLQLWSPLSAQRPADDDDWALDWDTDDALLSPPHAAMPADAATLVSTAGEAAAAAEAEAEAAAAEAAVASTVAVGDDGAGDEGRVAADPSDGVGLDALPEHHGSATTVS